MKRALALGAVSGLLAFGIAPAAQAGEVTGSGKVTPIKSRLVAASECAFSGLDDLSEPGSPSRDTRPRVTQSWGQIPKAVRDQIKPFASPGIACNPTKAQAGEPSGARIRR